MKMREEIDALRTMGREPLEVLVLPRIIALVVALPLLSLIGSLAALIGGGIVASFYGMEPSLYVARLREAVSMSDFEVGMVKAPFMALVIGLVACTEGFHVHGSSESLGARTTSSVVKANCGAAPSSSPPLVSYSSIGCRASPAPARWRSIASVSRRPSLD